jgi:hypothetical protein
MTIIRVTREEAEKLKSRTDAERLKNITDEEIDQAAKDDPDSAYFTDEELKEFKRGEHKGGGFYGHKESNGRASEKPDRKD